MSILSDLGDLLAKAWAVIGQELALALNERYPGIDAEAKPERDEAEGPLAKDDDRRWRDEAYRYLAPWCH